MCKALSPASFLAVAFRESKRGELDYGWLNAYRTSVRSVKVAGESVDVIWDHDSVNYTMGFFSPVFSTDENGVQCNLDALNHHFADITQGLDKALLTHVRKCAISCVKGKKATSGRRKVH